MMTSFKSLTANIMARRRTDLLSSRFLFGIQVPPLPIPLKGGELLRRPGYRFHQLPRFLFFFLFVFLFFSCGTPTGRFRVEGRFKNLNQGEFYIYDFDHGVKDTIAVRDGRFVYDIALRDTVTLTLLFPNYSELPIFARPGITVKVTGDVSSLRETAITGTRENEAMTAYRLRTNDMTPPEQTDAAREFIADNPTSPISSYLLRRYFILTPPFDDTATPRYDEALTLCTTMLEAQPQNVPLIQLRNQLERLQNVRGSGPLPSFNTIDTRGRSVGNMQLKSRSNVICVWASWSFDSQTMLRQLWALHKKSPGRLSLVSVCLDASPDEGRRTLERDSIACPTICDGRMWESPLVATLGITTVPATILIDAKGNIVGRNLNYTQLKERIEGEK